jgi:hypothetical protein
VAPVAARNAQDELERCIENARERATRFSATKGATAYEVRRQLEADITSCSSPTMSRQTALFIGTLQADLALFAQQFLSGTMDAVTYRNARLDRSRKLRELGEDRALHEDLQAKGDADRDLIPDNRDRCPRTPYGVPTDDQGCRVEGDRRRPAGNEGDLRRALGALKLLQNEACAQAPQPAVPDPVRYGRANANAPLPPGSLMFVVTQVGGMPAGCDVFYEIRMHFMDPVDVNAPETVERNIVFHQAEDLDSDPTAAMFGIRTNMAGSPGRQATLDAFKIYQRMRWRVRAVIGGPIMSPWGPNETQAPAIGGIPES